MKLTERHVRQHFAVYHLRIYDFSIDGVLIYIFYFYEIKK